MADDAPVAIVTGGAQGIGSAICIALLEKGYKVCVADIQELTGRQFVEEQQKAKGEERVIFSYCDVTKESDYKSTFELAIKAFHKVDVLINNAGIILERDPKKLIDVNLMGPIIGCQTALKYMGKSKGGNGGIVINTASIAGFLPYHAMPVYAASKHGVIGLTRSYGRPNHLETDGVVFAAVCPSFTNTDILKPVPGATLEPDLDFSKRPNLLKPDYVAQGVMKLLEDKINGSTLVVTRAGYQYVKYQEEFKTMPLD